MSNAGKMIVPKDLIKLQEKWGWTDEQALTADQRLKDPDFYWGAEGDPEVYDDARVEGFLSDIKERIEALTLSEVQAATEPFAPSIYLGYLCVHGAVFHDAIYLDLRRPGFFIIVVAIENDEDGFERGYCYPYPEPSESFLDDLKADVYAKMRKVTSDEILRDERYFEECWPNGYWIPIDTARWKMIEQCMEHEGSASALVD